MSTMPNQMLEIEAAIRTLERRADQLEATYSANQVKLPSLREAVDAKLDEARAIRTVVAEVRRTMDDGK